RGKPEQCRRSDATGVNVKESVSGKASHRLDDVSKAARESLAERHHQRGVAARPDAIEARQSVNVAADRFEILGDPVEGQAGKKEGVAQSTKRHHGAA